MIAEASSRRVALITGGARRLGAEITRSFAARGYDVLLHYGQSEGEATRLASDLAKLYGVSVVPFAADLEEVTAPAAIVKAAIDAFGALDVVVSSASLMLARPVMDITIDDWTRTEAINLRAPFLLMQAAARVMGKGGVIVQMADHLAEETGFPHLIPHQVTKAAIPQLVATMAVALAPDIRVCAVAPGLVLAPDDLSETAIANFLRDVPLARSGVPADVVQAIHYLLEAEYVTGSVLRVDGGRHLRR